LAAVKRETGILEREREVINDRLIPKAVSAAEAVNGGVDDSSWGEINEIFFVDEAAPTENGGQTSASSD